MLSFDPSEYLESTEATKPKSQRFLTTPQFDDQPATEAFEALFRKHDLGKPDED
ncbi:hypothetical protein [Corynebacterium casei]|nr:hypothetical protein [Corynebacterium casei]MDN5729012.1 hypothetical protein [Corynebacterium casei]